MTTFLRTLVVIAIVAGGIGALWYYDRLPGKTLLQSYEGTITEPYRVFDFERAMQRPQPAHGSDSENPADYDYYWRVKTDSGAEIKVQAPLQLWYGSEEGQRVSKARFSLFPTLGAPPSNAEADTEQADAAATEAQAPNATAGESPSASGAAPDRFEVAFVCDHGEFTAEFIRDWAPLGVDRVYELVTSGALDGSKFFRVVPGFVVQFGIPADPDEAARWRDARIQDDPVKQSNVRGTITFAAAGPNTRTSQMFVNYGDNTMLDQQGFAPVGRVISGMETVEVINSRYGEAPDQSLIQAMGDQYLSQQFPDLTVIKEARLRTDAAAPAPAATPDPTAPAPEETAAPQPAIEAAAPTAPQPQPAPNATPESEPAPVPEETAVPQPAPEAPAPAAPEATPQSIAPTTMETPAETPAGT